MADRSAMAFCTAVLSGILAAGPISVVHGQFADDALGRFQRSVADYMALRHEAQRDLPALELTETPLKMRQAIGALARAIRHARGAARVGDIFTPDVREVFAARLRHATRARGCAEAVRDDIYEDGGDWQPPDVDVAFSWTTASAMPPCVLAVLPALPEELQYRFIGPNLVLVDIDANLIVDVLTDAIQTLPGGHISAPRRTHGHHDPDAFAP